MHEVHDMRGPSGADEPYGLHDMHCHLNFMSNAEEVAAEARAAGMLLFANTVTPGEWREAQARFAPFENVAVGFGMHPWWVGSPSGETRLPKVERALDSESQQVVELGQSGERDLFTEEPFDAEQLIEQLDAASPRLLGEVGLDFGKRHRETRDAQLSMFRAIARWAAAHEGTLLSIHSVHAAADVLDVLDAEGALEACTCLFHWYSGPSDLLKRAVLAGCYFSIGPRMLASGKGREYVKAIPVSQMLLETDDPPEQGAPYSFAELQENLRRVAEHITSVRGTETLGKIASTSQALLPPPVRSIAQEDS